jgi:hypothetical protein
VWGAESDFQIGFNSSRVPAAELRSPVWRSACGESKDVNVFGRVMNPASVTQAEAPASRAQREDYHSAAETSYISARAAGKPTGECLHISIRELILKIVRLQSMYKVEKVIHLYCRKLMLVYMTMN